MLQIDLTEENVNENDTTRLQEDVEGGGDHGETVEVGESRRIPLLLDISFSCVILD